MENKIFVLYIANRQVIYTQWGLNVFIDIYGYFYILCKVHFSIKS